MIFWSYRDLQSDTYGSYNRLLQGFCGRVSYDVFNSKLNSSKQGLTRVSSKLISGFDGISGDF